MYCGHCGQECETKTVDIGYGITDRGRHSYRELVSDCCEDAVYEDEELENEVTLDDMREM